MMSAMPHRLPHVVSPLVPVLEHHGVTIVLVSVEVWPDERFVRMRGLPSEVTARLNVEFHEALEAWHRRGRTTDVPQQPAEQMFDFDPTVSDDVGTLYAPGQSARGGTFRMFRAEWTFKPGPPDSASRLTVRVGDGAVAAIDLAPAG